MRVANVALDGRLSGPAHRIVTLARALWPQGVETVVVLPDPAIEPIDEFASLLDEAGIPYRVAPLRRFTLRNGAGHVLRLAASARRQLGELADVLREERVDVVHANGVHQPHGALAGRLAGCAVAWQMNDCNTPRWVGAPFARAAWHAADVIPVTSEAAGRYHFPRRYDRSERFPVVPPPVDTTRLAPGSGPLPDPRRLITAGTLNPIKGMDVLVEAAGELERRGVDVSLRVVGPELATRPEYAAGLRRRIAELGLQERIELLGGRDDVPELLTEAGLYVSAARSEACSMALLEAMAAGRPVVATAVGGTPEVLRNGRDGVLVPPDDPKALARAVHGLVEDRDRAVELGRRARARAESGFSIPQAAEAHRRMYELARTRAAARRPRR